MASEAENGVLLEAKGLTRHFGVLAAVQGVDLTVRRGEICSIIGPNGAGKTTLFNLITGKLPPTEGTVRFKGEEITGLEPHRIARRGLARSFQLTNIFPELSVFENVRLAAQRCDPGSHAFWRRASALPEANRLAREILDQLHLWDYRDIPAKHLSYGYQRHLEIALVLATEPEMLLLDEPTSGMSPLETQATVRLIERVSRGLTLLLIEHDMEVVMRLSQRVVVMHYGRVIAEGTPQEVSRDPLVREAYLGGLA